MFIPLSVDDCHLLNLVITRQGPSCVNDVQALGLFGFVAGVCTLFYTAPA